MTKIINKKPLVLLIGFLMIFSAALFLMPVSAFNEPKASQTIDLTIVVTDQQMPGVENVTDEFLASDLGSGVNSVTVLSSGTTANDQLVFLQTLMTGGTATTHVIGLDVVWTAQFAANNWIIPLDSYLETNELDDYGSGIVSAGTYQGKLYAYPYFMNLGILWYNKEILDEHKPGWTTADFETWEGLNATANYVLNNVSGTLTADDADLVGYVGQFDAYEGGVVNFFEWCGSAGILDVVTSTGEVNIDTAGVNDAMSFLKALVPPQYTGVQGNKYIIPRYGLVHDEGSSVGKWLDNESIFMRQWPFAYGSSESNGMDFGVAPLPYFEGATGYKTAAVGGAILAVPSATTGTAREAAVNLTKFLGDTIAQEAELNSDTDPGPDYSSLSNFPALLSVYDSPPAGFEWIKNFTEQAALTLSRPVHPKYPEISNKIADYFSDLLSCQKSVDDALFEMDRDVTELISGLPEEPAIPGFSMAIVIMSVGFSIGIIILFKRRK